MKIRTKPKVSLRRVSDWLGQTFDGFSIRSKLIIGWFVFFTGLAISTGLLSSVQPMPDKSELFWETGDLKFDYLTESLTFRSFIRGTVTLCQTDWINFKDVSKILEGHEHSNVELNLYVRDLENENLHCLKAYGLTVNNDPLVNIEDVRDSKVFTKRLHKVIALIVMLYGVYEILSARRKQERRKNEE